MRNPIWRKLSRGLLAAGLSLGLAVAQAAVPMLSVGLEHSLALRSDGSVLAWGADQSGQLGQGRQTYESRPGRVRGLPPVKAIGSGANHTLAVSVDGAVWAWGGNGSGQLGDGGTLNRSAPAQARGVSTATAVCGGDNFSAALDQDGTVWTWGEGYHGVLGRGSQESLSLPAKVPGLARIRTLACGSRHMLALDQDGAVWAWGSNAQGALGDGSSVDRLVPVRVAGLGPAVAIAAGEDASIALAQDASVWEWGLQPSDTPASTQPRLRPLPSGLGGVAAIAGTLGHFELLAIGADRQTWWRWWGGTPPQLQASVGALRAVASGYGVTLLLKDDGTVLSFGFGGNGFGTLGDGTTTYRDIPGPVLDLEHIVQVAAGIWHALALDASGTVWSWGLDSSGQLGRGRVLSQSVPMPVAGLGSVVQVSAGTAHSLALDGAGQIWAWGSNGYGQLGDGSWADHAVPAPVTDLTGVQAVAAGSYYSVALDRDGTAWAWGATLPGVNTQDPSHPARVLDEVVSVATGSGHVLALRRDGSVWTWGDDGTAPRPVTGLARIRKIAASGASSFALDGDGTVLAWGGNWAGQLGDGTSTPRGTPAPVPGLTDVVDIAAGAAHGLARRRDGSVWGWGLAPEGALGAGVQGQGGPVRIAVPAPIQQLAAGGGNSALLGVDGLVYMAGDNTLGQLGDGTFARQADFVLAVNSATDGLLDLAPGVPKSVAAPWLPPFLVNTERRGDLSSLSLRANVFGRLAEGSAPRGPREAVRYNLYVAAWGGGADPAAWFQLDGRQAWSPLGWPMAAYMSAVNLSGRGDSVLAQILDNVDMSGLVGARIFVGYGTDAQEMLGAGRFREVMTIPAPR